MSKKIRAFRLIVLLLLSTSLTSCVPYVPQIANEVITQYASWRNGLGPYIAGRPIIYSTDFFYDPGDWSLGSYSYGTTAIDRGKLVIETDSQALELPSSFQDREYSDTAVRVTVANVTYTDERGAFGGYCRYQDANNYYIFIIGGDHKYSIFRSEDDDWIELVDWTETRQTFWRDEEIEFVFICDEDELVLAVNGTIVARAFDDTYSSGAIGVTSYVWIEERVEMAVDEVVIFDLRD